MFELIESRAELADCIVRFRQLHGNMLLDKCEKPIKYPCLVNIITEYCIPSPLRHPAPPDAVSTRWPIDGLRAIIITCYRPIAKKIVYPQKGSPRPPTYGFNVVLDQDQLGEYVDHKMHSEYVDKQTQQMLIRKLYTRITRATKPFPCLVTSRKVGEKGQSSPIVYAWAFFFIDVSKAKSLVYVKKDRATKTLKGKLSDFVLSYDAVTHNHYNRTGPVAGLSAGPLTIENPVNIELGPVDARDESSPVVTEERRISAEELRGELRRETIGVDPGYRETRTGTRTGPTVSIDVPEHYETRMGPEYHGDIDDEDLAF